MSALKVLRFLDVSNKFAYQLYCCLIKPPVPFFPQNNSLPITASVICEIPPVLYKTFSELFILAGGYRVIKPAAEIKFVKLILTLVEKYLEVCENHRYLAWFDVALED